MSRDLHHIYFAYGHSFLNRERDDIDQFTDRRASVDLTSEYYARPRGEAKLHLALTGIRQRYGMAIIGNGG